MNERCEPPPELRDRDGWHWVQCINGPNPDSYAPEIRWWYAPSVVANIVGWWEEADAHSDMDGYRYLAPVTPPATIAALVEALEAVSVAIPAVLDAADIDASDTVFTVRAVSPTGSRELAQRSLADMLEAARAALALYREAGR